MTQNLNGLGAKVSSLMSLQAVKRLQLDQMQTDFLLVGITLALVWIEGSVWRSLYYHHPFFVSAFHKSALWCLLLFIWYLPALNLCDLCVALLKDAKEIFTPSFLCKWAHYLCTLQAYVCIHHFKHTRQDCCYEWLTAAQNRISCLFLIYCIFIS